MFVPNTASSNREEPEEEETLLQLFVIRTKCGAKYLKLNRLSIKESRSQRSKMSTWIRKLDRVFSLQSNRSISLSSLSPEYLRHTRGSLPLDFDA